MKIIIEDGVCNVEGTMEELDYNMIPGERNYVTGGGGDVLFCIFSVRISNKVRLELLEVLHWSWIEGIEEE